MFGRSYYNEFGKPRVSGPGVFVASSRLYASLTRLPARKGDRIHRSTVPRHWDRPRVTHASHFWIFTVRAFGLSLHIGLSTHRMAPRWFTSQRTSAWLGDN